MKRVSIITLGCKVNQYDSDAMLKIFLDAGYTIYDNLQFADYYIVNTCAVTREAEKKSRQELTKILKVNPEAKIYVCGCASQNKFEQFQKTNVEYIQGNKNKIDLAKRIIVQGGTFRHQIADDFSLSDICNDCGDTASFKTRYFIKVQDGCNARCSYCIIPYLRGVSRSRQIDEIIAELDKQTNKKEIVLIGINLSAYGRDIHTNLITLLDSLKKYNFRIRLGSLEPNIITKEFINKCRELKNFCPHFHLSLQSANDEVLKDMRRAYRLDTFKKAVQLINEEFENPAITGDVIVGYPTETEEQFLSGVEEIKKMKFADIHVFPFSPREGTKAAEYKLISSEEMNKRLAILHEVKQRLRFDFLIKQVGRQLEVLFESSECGYMSGHSKNYVKVYSKGKNNNEVHKVTAKGLYLDGVIAE